MLPSAIGSGTHISPAIDSARSIEMRADAALLVAVLFPAVLLQAVLLPLALPLLAVLLLELATAPPQQGRWPSPPFARLRPLATINTCAASAGL